jgi:hypothetical protein
MQVMCPLAIPNYNTNMQGVDHHDQLGSMFSLSYRHVFKNYYITHPLAHMDMGITNAAIYYFEDTPHLKKGRVPVSLSLRTPQSTCWMRSLLIGNGFMTTPL